MGDVGERRVSREPQHRPRALIANVVRAEREIRDLPAIVVSGPNANGDPGQSRERRDPTDELRRPENPFVAREAGREIGDAKPTALPILEFGLDDRRVAG